ncbi:Ldh family oxidoreductase [Candidatus Latescibacterota bacterium]
MPTISQSDLTTWTAGVFVHLGVHPPDASLIARCLVDVDLRGIRSHGTRQLRRYVPEFRDGLISLRPEIQLLKDTGTTVRFDGDGGAGYLVATRAVDLACERAGEHGIALATTRYHGHVGSKGIYARRAGPRGLISWSVAGGGPGWSPPADPEATVWDAMSAPAMCFGIPASEGGPPLVLDMNANQFGGTPRVSEAIAAGFGKSVFGSLGMRFIATLLGGHLAGSGLDLPERQYRGASRGFLFVAIDPGAIEDGQAFRDHVRYVIDETLKLPPIPGTDCPALPGTLEWQRERQWATEGIPLPDDHGSLLDGVAAELGIGPPPWR